MKGLLSKLKNSPTAILISFSTLLLTTGKAAIANETIQTIELLEKPDKNVKTVSFKSQKACIRHTKLKKFFCANAQELSHLRKGNAEVDSTDLNNQEDLLNISDEESDAAVAMFGCDCIASINCLRRLRNRLP
ncbi:hypothetical protein RINTHM_15060 [Richelia intracellularis HM01]|uniref:hypothetical protein n=1 Tax=Richelia intracellularis TaxID=1164990 RepID=UPI0002B5E0DC|nr:hypothetical protein [Richelia intracellularis]CCH65963.1 hypothetical protein RINTHM_15060 [Richelia intracellularis HM01]